MNATSAILTLVATPIELNVNGQTRRLEIEHRYSRLEASDGSDGRQHIASVFERPHS